MPYSKTRAAAGFHETRSCFAASGCAVRIVCTWRAARLERVIIARNLGAPLRLSTGLRPAGPKSRAEVCNLAHEFLPA